MTEPLAYQSFERIAFPFWMPEQPYAAVGAGGYAGTHERLRSQTLGLRRLFTSDPLLVVGHHSVDLLFKVRDRLSEGGSGKLDEVILLNKNPEALVR